MAAHEFSSPVADYGQKRTWLLRITYSLAETNYWPSSDVVGGFRMVTVVSGQGPLEDAFATTEKYAPVLANSRYPCRPHHRAADRISDATLIIFWFTFLALLAALCFDFRRTDDLITRVSRTKKLQL